MSRLEEKVELCSGRVTREEIERINHINKRRHETEKLATGLGFLSSIAIGETALAIGKQIDNPSLQIFVFGSALGASVLFGLTSNVLGDKYRTGNDKDSQKCRGYDMKYSFAKDKAKKIFYLKSIANLTVDPAFKHEIHAHIGLLEGDAERALDEHILMLSALNEIKRPASLLESFYISNIDALLKRIRVKRKPNIINYMELAALYATVKKKDKVRETLLNALSKNKDLNSVSKLLAAEFLDNSGYKDDADKIFRETLDKILEDPKINLAPFGRWRHDISTDKYSFIFKKDDVKDVLEKEHNLLRIVRDSIAEYSNNGSIDVDSIKIIKPFKFIQHSDGKYYLITKRNRIENAESAIENLDHAEKDGLLKNILRSIAFVDVLATKRLISDGYLKQIDYREELNRRLILRLGSNSSLSRFLENYGELVNKIEVIRRDSDLSSVAIGDAYLSNALGDGTLLDFESMGIADFTRDPASLLDHPSVIEVERYFTYYRDLLQHFSERIFNKLTLDDLFLMNRVCNAMCQIGSKLNQGKDEQALFYFNRVLDSIQLLGYKNLEAAFKDYVMHSEKTAKVLL